jgi:type IV fimbrial biogenesis protein FimT
MDNIRNNRLTTQANTFVATLNFPRSEALKRGVRVTLCRSSNGTSCNTETAKNRRWETGWLVFAESVTVNGQLDTSETLLRAGEALPNETTLRTGDHFARFVQYLPSGMARGGGTTGSGASGSDTFLLCDPRGAVQLMMSTNEEQRTSSFQYAQAIVDEVAGATNEGALQVCGNVNNWVVDNYPAGDPLKPASTCGDQALVFTATGAYSPKVRIQRLAPVDSSAPRIAGREYSAAAFRSTYFGIEAQYNEPGERDGFSRIVQGYSVLIPGSGAI